MNNDIEIRSFASDIRANAGRLTGRAIPYNSLSQDLGGFVERVIPGALTNSLANPANIRALVEHDPMRLLGRVASQTLKLEERADGLHFELHLPNVSYANDIATLVERGDIAGVSFSFKVEANGERWEMRSEQLTRDLLNINLLEISIVSDPAYAETSVAKRSMDSYNAAKNFDDFLKNPIMINLDYDRRYLDTY